MAGEPVTTTIDGVPWRDARVLGDNGPTCDEWNRDVLAPLSREHGYCLCYHPFSNVINFAGTGCAICGQPVTEDSAGPEAKRLRTDATLAAYPHLRRTDDATT